MGWFLPDRIDLPFVTALDPAPAYNPVSGNRRTNLAIFPDRNWSGKWNAWRVLDEFVLTYWTATEQRAAKAALDGVLANKVANHITDNDEIDLLVLAAQNERADALGEILAQDVEFITYFMGVLNMAPGSYPKTYRVLHIASLVGSFAALHFKAHYDRVRASQLCPALLPPVALPGHSSYPSGHSTQAHLMASCVGAALAAHLPPLPAPDLGAINDDLLTLAERIARNREIAGLHYPSDSVGGKALASSVFGTLSAMPAGSRYATAIAEAAEEWQ